MENIAEEIERSRKEIGLTQDELSEIMDMNSKTLRSRMKDSGSFTFEELKSYALYLETKGFLFEGYEMLAMFRSDKSCLLKAASEFVALSSGLDIECSEGVKLITIPKLSVTASCGGGNHVESIDCYKTDGVFVIDADSLRIATQGLKAIKVDGYSMVPTLLPDSWVIFNDVDVFSGDGLYVLNWRNILMVKLLQINSDGQMRIISTNKDYESYTIDHDDQSVFKIFGKVVKVMF